MAHHLQQPYTRLCPTPKGSPTSPGSSPHPAPRSTYSTSSTPPTARAPGTLADRQAFDAYRRRLAAIDNEADEAERHHDHERVARLEAERQALLDEVLRIKDVHGRLRQFANHPAERARKAVTARVRDAIRNLEPLLPDLAAHLQRTIVTGNYCRYRDGHTTTWDVDHAPSDRPTIPTT